MNGEFINIGGGVCGNGRGKSGASNAVAMRDRPQEKNVGVKSVINNMKH